MKKISLLILLFAMMACSKNRDNEVPIGGIFIDVDIILIIKDISGKNLLDTLVPNHFDISTIKLYYIREDAKEEVYNPMLSLPRNLKIRDYEGEYFLHLFTDGSRSNYESEVDGVLYGESITLLQLNENTIDTIKTAWKAGRNYFVNTKVWYNNELKWELQGEIQEMPILVIK
ncbi:MAG: hypothetical protein PF484_01180 [Bacteroidales bacterium]|nr:hypothetical protein [Bacteroidales bacterium]